MKKFEESMCKTPFNSSFGIYLYLEKNDHSVFMEPFELLRSILSNGIRDYDIFRLFEYTSDEIMKEMENAHIQIDDKHRAIYLKFIKEVHHKFTKKQNVEKDIEKFLKAVNANNLAQVKKCVGSGSS